MNKRNIFMIALIVLISSTLIFANGNLEQSYSSIPIVAVSIAPLESIVHEIGGDNVEIVTVIPPGYSPESYETTPKTRALLSDADLFFGVGVPAEVSIKRILGDKTKAVDLGQKIATVIEPRKLGESNDPHIWLSIERVKILSQFVEEELSTLIPSQKNIFETNTKIFLNKLDVLEKRIEKQLSNIEVRSFFVYHPSLGYFADEYGLNMFALEDEGKPAESRSLSELIDLGKKEKIKLVLYQEGFSKRQVESFASEIGGKIRTFNPLTNNYIDMMENLANVFSEGLK